MRRSVLGKINRLGFPRGSGFASLPGNTLLFRDDFTGVLGTSILDNTRTITARNGYLWTGGVSTLDGAGNVNLINTSVGVGTPSSVVEFPTPNLEVNASLRFNAGTEQSCLVFNYVNPVSFYMARTYNSAGVLNISLTRSQDNGAGSQVHTLLANAVKTAAVGDFTIAKVQTNGDTATVYFDGVLLTNYTAASRMWKDGKKFGVMGYGAGAVASYFEAKTLLTVANAAPGTVLFMDDFNDSGVVDITASTRAIAQRVGPFYWTLGYGPINTSGTGKAVSVNNATRISVTIPTTSVDVSCSFTVFTNSDFGVLVRWLDINNHIVFRIFGTVSGTKNVQTLKLVSGAYTSLQLTNGVAIPDGPGCIFRVQVIGSELKCWLNGVLYITYTITDASLLSGTGSGLWQDQYSIEADYFEVKKP